MYKRQMRSNPEAIVKFGVRVGSPTKGRSRSRGSGEEEAEAEMQGGGGEEETQQWRMDIDGGQDEEEEEEEDSWVDRHRKRNRSRSKSVDASSNRNRKSNPPHAPPAWLPEALQHLSSSSDDEEERDVKDLLKEAKKVKERARRRERELAKEREREERQEREKEGRKRRVKPFPMRKERERKMDEEVEERYPSPVGPNTLFPCSGSIDPRALGIPGYPPTTPHACTISISQIKIKVEFTHDIHPFDPESETLAHRSGLGRQPRRLRLWW
jgi:hypothetical protein